MSSSVTVLSAVEMKASISAALAVPVVASIAMAIASMRIKLPMSFPAIPGVEQIGEPVIAESGDLMNARQADEPSEPAVARGRAPNGDGAVGADVETSVGIDAVQPAAHIRQRGAEAGQRIGLQIDVAEFDHAGAGRAHQPAALPIDAGVTDRAFGIVPDRELRAHCCAIPAASRTAFQRLYSLAMNAPNSAAVEPLTTTPTVTRRSRTLSSAMMSLRVLFSLATTVAGTPGGPNTPYQVVTS